MKKKKVLALICCVLFALSFVGCSFKKYKSITYRLTTGDTVKVTLDKSDGYGLVEGASNTLYFLEPDGKRSSVGAFGSKADYFSIYNSLAYDVNVTIYDRGSDKNIEYVFYKTVGAHGEEYDYIIYIKDSNSCFIMGNQESKSSAEEVFNRLEFQLK